MRRDLQKLGNESRFLVDEDVQREDPPITATSFIGLIAGLFVILWVGNFGF